MYKSIACQRGKEKRIKEKLTSTSRGSLIIPRLNFSGKDEKSKESLTDSSLFCWICYVRDVVLSRNL